TMLKQIGAESVEELFSAIPDELIYKKEMDIPEALAEFDLSKHLERTLNKNTSTKDVISFLGGGCWEHSVRAVCDEANYRAEFLTAYAGDEYEDHGRFQVLFENQS